MRAPSTAKPPRRKRRRFRYRRFHALHLDLAMVLLLTVAGWSLCPAPRIGGRGFRAPRMTVEVRASDGQTAEDLLHAPTLFAFRSPAGFSGGDLLPGGASADAEPLKLPSDPAFDRADFMPLADRTLHWPGAAALGARIPEPPAFGAAAARPAAGPARLLRKPVWCATSDPGVVAPDASGLELRAMAGREIRVHVVFGMDGGAEAAVLGRHALPPAEANALERLAMTVRGPAGASCQLVFHVPE